MWGYVTGTIIKPANKKAIDYAETLDAWESDNSKIITWINNYVMHLIGAQFAKFETTKEVWNHLSRLYTQSNFARQYQLEIDIHTIQ